MNYPFDIPISALAVHPSSSDQICLGFLDGEIGCYNIDVKNNLKNVWKKKLKRAIRAIQFSYDGSSIFTTSSNRALCMYDTETSRRTRCLREGHKSRPNALSLLPCTEKNGQQFATGAENGEIKTWDFRQPKPHIATFKDQGDVINAFGHWKNSLLAVSSDGTLAVYDLHKNSLKVQSETMHSELLSLAVTDRFTYAGAADGHIEVFNNGEFGNIRERIETPLIMGVEQLLVAKNNLLIAAASTIDEMRLIHVSPNKPLDGIPCPGAVDLIAKTFDSKRLLVTAADGINLKMCELQELIADAMELRAQDMHKIKLKQKEMRKRKRPANGDFFMDMLSDKDEEEVDDYSNDNETDDDDDDDLSVRK